MDTEAQVLRDKGLSESEIPTVLKARKSTSCKVYHLTWKPYFTWCEERKFHPMKWSVEKILTFYNQSGISICHQGANLMPYHPISKTTILSFLFKKYLYRVPLM